MYQTYKLSHYDASRIISFVQQKLEAGSKGAAVAVVDEHGELIAFLRTDGCPLASINNAIHKAFTAARERGESGLLGERSRQENFPMTNFGDLRYTGWGGGVPILYQNTVIGGIGISGLPEADDVLLARQAAEILE